MPYVVQAGSIVLLTVVGSDPAGGVTINDFHYQDTGTGSITDGADMLQKFLDLLMPPEPQTSNFKSSYLNAISGNWTCTYAQAQWIYPTRYIPRRNNIGRAANNANPALPAVNAVTIKKITDFATKRNRGRIFMPCPPSNYVDSAGKVTAAGIAGYQSMANRIVEQVSPGLPSRTFIPVIFHHDNPASPTPITNAIAGDRVQTMRRRIFQRGI